MFDWVCDIAYGITSTIAYFMGLLYQCFEVVAGLDTVTYQGDSSKTLLEVIFSDSLLNRAYWGMAIIGIGLCFFFTIIAVIRKMFDSSDQMKTSLGEILTQCFKSVLLICSMSLLLSMTLFFTTSLLNAVQIAFFSNTAEATTEKPKTFSDDEYAIMARVLNTIGNYSLNPSYNSRYNLNSCYNEIRGDLQLLVDKGTFDVQYEIPDLLNNSSHYWQESLQKIVNAAPNLNADVPLDVYNETLAKAILNSMDQVRKNDNFKPLKSYAYAETSSTQIASLDRIVLLMGTFDASYSDNYNGENASLTDPLRAPFYYGSKDIYSTDDMWASFDLWDYGYFTGIFLSFVLLKNMVVIVLNAIARIFNMALLYVIAPPFIALSPLDGGGKFKQWMTAFIVQCFAVFGTVIGMDMMVVFVPIIMSGKMVIFESAFINYFAKVVIVWGAYETVKKANNLITGILADNAGMQALYAGDMSQSAGKLTGAVGSVVGAVTGASAVKWAAGKTWENAKGRIQENLPFGTNNKNDPGKKDPGKKVPDGGKDGGGSRNPIGSGGISSGENTGKASGGDKDRGESKNGEGGQNGPGGDAQKASGGEKDSGAPKNGEGGQNGPGGDAQKASGGEKDSGAPKNGEGGQDAPGGDARKASGGDKDRGESKNGEGGQNGPGGDAQKFFGGDKDRGNQKIGERVRDAQGRDEQKASNGDRDIGVHKESNSHSSRRNPIEDKNQSGGKLSGENTGKASGGDKDRGNQKNGERVRNAQGRDEQKASDGDRYMGENKVSSRGNSSEGTASKAADGRNNPKKESGQTQPNSGIKFQSNSKVESPNGTGHRAKTPPPIRRTNGSGSEEVHSKTNLR